MNKVIIPAAVAAEIENYRIDEFSNESIVTETLRARTDCDSSTTLRSIPFDTLLSALVNGYEREKTKEERHAELLAKYTKKLNGGDSPTSDYENGYTDGVFDALYTLGIVVNGINGGVCK